MNQSQNIEQPTSHFSTFIFCSIKNLIVTVNCNNIMRLKLFACACILMIIIIIIIITVSVLQRYLSSLARDTSTARELKEKDYRGRYIDRQKKRPSHAQFIVCLISENVYF